MLSGTGVATALLAGALAVALAIALAMALAVILLARSRARLAAELRDARTRADCLEPLLDAWLWHSGPDHRMLATRPVHGASAEVLAPGLLWERFMVDDAAALRLQLDAATPLDDLPAQLVGAETAPRPGLLRGRAYRDAAGAFAGYHGIFREVAPPPPPPPAPPPAADTESFNHVISHDLRAPIRVVEGFTKIVKEDYGPLLDRVGNDHLDRVLGAAARLNGMVDALLMLSKLSTQPLARQPVDLSELAGQVADDLRRRGPERAVQIEIEPGLRVHGDPALLRTAVEHLLTNAWKFSAKSTQARIDFGRHPQEADTFTVEDNGAGFDMRFADRLFGVFQRLHSANDFPGAGIGLAAVRRIVRRHGGEVRGEAEVSRGARFHFSLPQRGETTR